MLDIVRKLEEGGENYKNEVLESLQVELQNMKEMMNTGVSPEEYSNYGKYIGALESSLIIMNKYVVSVDRTNK